MSLEKFQVCGMEKLMKPNEINFDDIFGTPAHHLHRTDDVDTSVEAANLVDTSELESLVYETIKSFGDRGCISDEVRAKLPGLPYSSVTARYRALLDKDLIVDTGERRKGWSTRNQRVLKIKGKDNE